MILGIDASNIRAGGGITHLKEILDSVDLYRTVFSNVILWASIDSLNIIPDKPWLKKINYPNLNGNPFKHALWQKNTLDIEIQKYKCNLLFIPGGFYLGKFHPFVTMNRNLLPFSYSELFRYGFSYNTLRMLLLRQIQQSTLRKADGNIFLTKYAQNKIMHIIKSSSGKSTVIPHGVSDRFCFPPRGQFPISNYNQYNPFRLLYVSKIDVYKHQWNVVEATSIVRSKGYPIKLDLVGPAYPPALKKLNNVIDRLDPDKLYIRYLGEIPYTELHNLYKNSNMGIFASSCETFGQILIETMSAGLPIICSNRSAMPELLKNAGIYFDPENPYEIAKAIINFLDSPNLRANYSQKSFTLAKSFSWKKCVDSTFSFLTEVAGPEY